MKSEFKVEISNTSQIKKLINNSYSEGRLLGNNNEILLDDSDKNDLIKFNNVIVKITNSEIIDGFCRCLVKCENDDVKLSCVSNYLIEDDGRFIFY